MNVLYFILKDSNWKVWKKIHKRGDWIMIKVFLVEDEIVMRNGIKNNIPWEKEGLEFAGEASDGELAYPLIRLSLIHI